MRRYTLLDGYTATKGYEMEQDEKGNILIATDNGGMMFDGKKFRVLMDTRQSPDAEILFVRPIGDSRILLLPINNTASYLYKGKLYTDKQDQRLKGTRMAFNHNWQDPVTHAWWLSNGRLSTLYRFYKDDIKKYEIDRDSFEIVGIVNDNFIIVRPALPGNPGWAAYYNINTNTYQQLYFAPGQKVKYMPGDVMYAGADPDYISYYSPQTKQLSLHKFAPPDSILQLAKTICIPAAGYPHITIDRNRNLWLKLNAGLGTIEYYGNITDHKVTQQKYRFPPPFVINSILIDRNSNIWFSSPNNTLYFLSEKHFKNALLTERFPMQKEIPQAISGNGQGKLCISYINNPSLLCIEGRKYKT